MPMIRVQLSVPIHDMEKQTNLMSRLSAEVAKQLSKPESYMMVVLEPETPIMMSTNTEPSALIEVRSVGTISGDQAGSLSGSISKILSNELSLSADRIYINFAGIPGAMWGYNGRTFG